MSVHDTLRQRQLTHGDFATNAHVAQGLKNFFFNQPGYDYLTNIQREALDLIATKIGRILSAGNNNPDNWHDIAGYAILAEGEVRATIESERAAAQVLEPEEPELPNVAATANVFDLGRGHVTH